MSDIQACNSLTPAVEHHHHHHHHHGHHRPGNAGEGIDYAEANRQHYDRTVDEFDNYPHVKERAIRVGLAIRNAVGLTKESTAVLEFACGTGLVCKEIVPYVHTINGIDISSAVVERCNRRLKEADAGAGSFAVAANIATEQDVLDGLRFDVVYCASAYHHFESPEEITKLLATFIKPSGSLLIIDNIQIEGKEVPEQYRDHVTRYGFTEDDMKKLFEDAGLEYVSYEQIPSDEGDNELFIAKAVKKA